MSNVPAIQGGPERVGLEYLPDGTLGRCLSAFFVPRNWCGGSRVQIAFQSVFARTVVQTTAKVVACVYNLDETFAGFSESVTLPLGVADGTVTIRVPQDGEYQVKVFLQYFDGTAGSDTLLSNYAAVTHISARYMPPDSSDLGGQDPGQTLLSFWQPHVNLPTSVSMPMAAVFIRRMVWNTLWMWAYRGPELCQTWLGRTYGNTPTFTEVGRYRVWIPHGLTTSGLTGRIVVRNEGIGGAGCEVRLLINGVVSQTWAALPTGGSVLTWGPTSGAHGVFPGVERTITIEARHVQNNVNHGMNVLGVFLWEADADTVATAAPATFKPLDEAGLEGDDWMEVQNNVLGQRAGFNTFLENDRWLYKNRLRTLVADWRHYVHKRLAVYASALQTTDPRVDWTRGDSDLPFQVNAYKNITICGDTGTDETDAIGDFPNGLGVPTGYTEIPYTYPSGQTFLRHGRRVGFYYMGHVNSGVAADLYGSWGLRVRGRRARPAVMSQDQNGFGPTPEEVGYQNRGYFEPVHNGSVAINTGGGNRIQVLGTPNFPDYRQRWHPVFRALHASGSGLISNSIRGRLPGVATGSPPVVRPEGRLFEMELNSVFWADEPLSQEALDALA